MSRTTRKYPGLHGDFGYHVRSLNLNQEPASHPVGNDEYEQSIAEHVLYSKIAETAICIAQQRGFVPGHELSDWIQAKTQVGGELTTEFFERRNCALVDRRTGSFFDRRTGALVDRRTGSVDDRRH